jgi:hypothetical protein
VLDPRRGGDAGLRREQRLEGHDGLTDRPDDRAIAEGFIESAALCSQPP